MTHLQIQPTSFKPALVTRLMALCWLLTKLFCYKLWLAGRPFPLVPVHDILLQVPAWVHGFLFVVMLIALPALLIFPQKKWLILALMVAEFCSCLLDQNRWKPWEYQFMFMLLPLLLTQDDRKIKISWQVIATGLYFFSGLSKLNSGFIFQIWNHLILQQWLGITTHNPWIYRLGYLLPLVEMAAALALLFGPCRKWGLAVICGMHVMLIIVLGPPAGNFTNAIWPWNLLMIFILVHLFYNNRFHFLLLTQRQLLVWVMVCFWWVMPWLNLAGLWDDYFSAVLYSGKNKSLYICTSNMQTKKNYAAFFVKTNYGPPCDTMLSVSVWSRQTMNADPNPEERVYRSIIRQWILQNDPAGADHFFILNPKRSEQRWREITPAE